MREVVESIMEPHQDTGDNKGQTVVEEPPVKEEPRIGLKSEEQADKVI